MNFRHAFPSDSAPVTELNESWNVKMWTSWGRTLNPSAKKHSSVFRPPCLRCGPTWTTLFHYCSRFPSPDCPEHHFCPLPCLLIYSPHSFRKWHVWSEYDFLAKQEAVSVSIRTEKFARMFWLKIVAVSFQKKKKRKQTELPWNNFFIKLSYSVPTKSDWLRSTSPKGRAWSWRTLRLLFAICSIMLEVKVVLHPVSCASRQEPVNQIKDLATTRLSRSLL